MPVAGAGFPADVHGDLPRPGRHHAAKGEGGARDPVPRSGAGPNETLPKGRVVTVAGSASGHEDRLRGVHPPPLRNPRRSSLLVGQHLAPHHEPGRKCQIDLGRPVIGQRQVDVEVVLGNGPAVSVGHGLEVRPLEQVGSRQTGDGPPAHRSIGRSEVARVDDVLLFDLRPEEGKVAVQSPVQIVPEQRPVSEPLPGLPILGDPGDDVGGASLPQTLVVHRELSCQFLAGGIGPVSLVQCERYEAPAGREARPGVEIDPGGRLLPGDCRDTRRRRSPPGCSAGSRRPRSGPATAWSSGFRRGSRHGRACWSRGST